MHETIEVIAQSAVKSPGEGRISGNPISISQLIGTAKSKGGASALNPFLTKVASQQSIQ